jgi:uncharacterized protein (TIGR01777 family)
MRIAITGSSGFIGSAAAKALRAAGHDVVRLVRGAADQPDAVPWRPETGEVDVERLGDVDAVLHLAGENVASGRWTAAKKRRIADSRGPLTERLCQTLAKLPRRPATLVSASATGIYGDRGDEILTEQSATGSDFLADVATAWEAGTTPARDAGVRVVNLRIGIVLDGAGGALARMLLPFRLGIGGRLGSGEHWMSWISRSDLERVIERALNDEQLDGPVLAVSPQPVTNRAFTGALGRALRRPTVMPVPALALRLLFGDLAHVLLASQRALPVRLQDAGFEFTHADLESALRTALDRSR